MKRSLAIFEMVLLIIMSFSIAYLISETNDYYPGFETESNFIKQARAVLLYWLSGGLVSAQTNTYYTCYENVNGTLCQTYPADVCDDFCAEPCIPSDEIYSCELGTCYDDVTGVCQPATPRVACFEAFEGCDNDADGCWFPGDEPPSQCNRGCCIIDPYEADGETYGSATFFRTEQECNYLVSQEGYEDFEFDGTIITELGCFFRTGAGNMGACLLDYIPAEAAYDCDFTTFSNCNSLGGIFTLGALCTNDDLPEDTVCTSTEETTCGVDGRVYYLDSCDNLANIYNANEGESYWQILVSPADSCNLDLDVNQHTCGNCNYESICGTPQELDSEPLEGEYVCRNLNCASDEWGNSRLNGEDWCAFDGKIGVQQSNDPDSQNGARSVDTVGSLHYLRSCREGEIISTSCYERRNLICVENVSSEGISSAGCRTNFAQDCINVNLCENQGGCDDIPAEVTWERVRNDCSELADCYLKEISVTPDFKFPFCIPKHPKGSDLRGENGGETASALCSLGSQTCNMMYEKVINWGGIFSGDFITWECQANCDCPGQKFTQSLNNVCMSLGDCGGGVNWVGDYRDGGYTTSSGRVAAPRLNSAYKNSLETYAEVVPGQFVNPLSLAELEELWGVIFGGDSSAFVDFLGALGLGGAGTAFGVWALGSGAGAAGAGAAGAGAAGAGAAGAGAAGAGAAGAGGPALGSFGSTLGAAAVGAGVGWLIGSLLGYEGDELATFIVAGAITGLIAGGLFVYGGGALFSVAALGAVLFPIIIVLLLVWIFFEIFGIGDIESRSVKFECLPWQPPVGGQRCDECNGDDVRPCSEYKCESLGQACELVNEGIPGLETCAWNDPYDVNRPVIQSLEEAIGEDFFYTEEIVDQTVRIESSVSEDGCITEYSPVTFGLELDEVGQCKLFEHSSVDWDDGEYFGGSNLFKTEHQMTKVMPSLGSLGESGIGPDVRVDPYTLHARCQDQNGNGADRPTYTINFCVAPADDIMAPVIVEFVPPSPAPIAIDTTTKHVLLYTNEPADCRWDFLDRDYFLMQNESVVLCNNDIDEHVFGRGWACNTFLDIPAGDEEFVDYYFRCLDQPWLSDDQDPENDVDRIASSSGTNYLVQRTTQELIIDYVTPIDGTVIVTGYIGQLAVEMGVGVSGGIDGTAGCTIDNHFLGNGYSSYSIDYNLFPGNYQYDFTCLDSAGNEAAASTSFTIDLDNVGPMITRVYDDGGTLNVITDEPSECAYDYNSCSFSFEDGTLMSGNNLVHTTSFEDGLLYYIKCRDSWGNIGSCMTVTGGY